MAAHDSDGKAMERVCQVWQADLEQWSEEKDEAKCDYNSACQSRKALQRLYTDLWPKKVDLVQMTQQLGGWRDGVDPWTRYPGNTWRVATGNLVQGGGRVAATVTAGISEVFQNHIAVLANFRYKPPEAELNAVVASLRRPVALDALHDILARAMADIYTRINDLGFKEDDVDRRIKYLDKSTLEMRHKCLRFRCTCKTYQHLT